MEATTGSEDHDKPMTAEEAAEFLGLSTHQLYKLNTTGLPCYKVGRTIKYRRSELNAWLQASE